MTVSYSTAETDMKDVVNFMYELKETHHAAVVADSDPIYDSYSSDDPDTALKAKLAVRTTLVTAWEAGKTALAGITNEMARSIGYQTASGSTFDEAAAEYVLDYMTDKGQFTGDNVSKKVTARGITRGTLNSPSGVTLIRVPYDKRGQASQIGYAEAINASVTSPSNATANKYNVRIASEKSKGVDVFDAQGSGAAFDLAVLTEETGRTPELLVDANLVATGADGNTITAFGNTGSWTVSGTWEDDTGKLYRTLTTSALTSEDGAYFEQTLPADLDPNFPVIPYAIVNPTGFTGSMDIAWGDKSQAAISVGSDDSWNVVVPDMDGDLFPEQFDQAGGTVRFTVNRSGGSLVIARAGLLQLQGGISESTFGSFWGAIIGDTSPLLGANATTTDTLSLSGKIADIYAVAFGVSMPVAGTNTVSDPI